MKKIFLFFMLAMILSTTSHAAILHRFSNGGSAPLPDLETARTSPDCAGKMIQITSALTQDQSNILGPWPADRGLEFTFGGSIANSTPFTFTDGRSFSAGMYHIFKGTGAVTGFTRPVYPEYWGTNTTPGATDMWAAWQSALDTYVKVIGSATIYAISKPLEIEWCDIEGAGVGSSLTPSSGKTVIRKTTHTAGTHADVAGWSEHYNVDSVISIVAPANSYSNGWSIKGIQIQGVSTSSRNTHIIYAPRVAQFEIKRVEVDFGVNGFYSYSAWDVSIDHFRGGSCDTFLKMADDGTHAAQSTSWTASNMGTTGCINGYDIFGLLYSTINSSYAEGTTGTAWAFTNSKNVTLNGCGGENPTGAILSINTADIIMSGCQFGQIIGVNGISAISVVDSNLLMLNTIFQDFSVVNGAKNMTITGAGSPSSVKLIGSTIPVSGSATTVDGFSTLLRNTVAKRVSLRGATDTEFAYTRSITDTTTAVSATGGVVTGTGTPTYEYVQLNDRVFFTITVPSVVTSGSGAAVVILDVPFVLPGAAYGTAYGAGASGLVTANAATQIRADITATAGATTTWTLSGSFKVQ